LDFSISLKASNLFVFKVTPPEEPTPLIGVPCVSSSGINPALGGSSLGLNQQSDHTSIQINTPEPPSPSVSHSPSQHHLQGYLLSKTVAPLILQ
jgi:potassium channel subfamily T member 1